MDKLYRGYMYKCTEKELITWLKFKYSNPYICAIFNIHGKPITFQTMTVSCNNIGNRKLEFKLSDEFLQTFFCLILWNAVYNHYKFKD